jgi:hypothetical protein
MTDKQEKLYKFCTDPKNMRLPTLRVIKEHMGWRSDNSAVKMLKKIAEQDQEFYNLLNK